MKLSQKHKDIFFLVFQFIGIHGVPFQKVIYGLCMVNFGLFFMMISCCLSRKEKKFRENNFPQDMKNDDNNDDDLYCDDNQTQKLREIKVEEKPSKNITTSTTTTTFNCDKCEESFGNSISLNEHLWSHD